MNPGPAAFAMALAQGERRRLRLDELRALWRRADPISAGAEDAHARFRRVLDELAQAGLIVLPASAAAWDRSIRPSLPRSVVVPAVRPRVRLSPPPTAWIPELSFAAAERHPATLDALQAINRWLKRTRGQPLPRVPVAERSLEIFGDEKRLDGLCVGETLFAGRLCLADLACERPPPFLLWHPGQSARSAVLVVENAAAFASFRRFNEDARLWRAVIWGAGNAFCRTHAGLAEIFAATGAHRAVYFGDLDPKGVEILARVMRQRTDDFRPHSRLYRALVRRGLARRDPSASRDVDRTTGELHACLPELARQVLALWREGMVLPQEGFGFQALTEEPAAAAEY